MHVTTVIGILVIGWIAVLSIAAVLMMAHRRDVGLEARADRGDVFLVACVQSDLQCGCLEGMPARFAIGSAKVPVCMRCVRTAFLNWQRTPVVTE